MPLTRDRRYWLRTGFSEAGGACLPRAVRAHNDGMPKTPITPSGQASPQPDYVPPALTTLGSLHAVTHGPHHGSQPDGIGMTIHVSG